MSWYCAAPGCPNRAVWLLEDTVLGFCDAHTGDDDDDADVKEKRRQYADDHARDIEREANR